jgi:uncharacterized Zn finger protein
MARPVKTKSSPSPITEKAIRDYVDSGSFARGLEYHREGMIFDPRVEGGNLLKARCEGSSGGPYRVEATVYGGRILAAECTCPVGACCKHIVALLLAWKDQPESFVAVEGLDTVLQGKTKAELVALVKEMVAREPDLETLVEVPVPKTKPKGGKRGGAAATAETYQRQAAAVFRRNRPDWDDEYDEYGDSDSARQCAAELGPIVSIGDEFLKDKDYAAALAVFQGVLAAFIEDYDEEFQDEEGDLSAVADHCVGQLGHCLKHFQDDPVRREAILRAVYEIHRFDFEGGGVELTDESWTVLTEKTTPQERRVVVGWVRADLGKKSGSSWSDAHRRRAYGALLLDLEADQLDDEAYLKICRETGLVHVLINRLLERKRLDEALQETRKLDAHELLQAATLFLRHRQTKLIEDLVRERAEKSQDRRLWEWLKDRAVKSKDWSTALELAEAMFRAQPGLAEYQMVRTIAQKAKRWGSLRPRLMEFLAAKHQTGLIIEIHLNEGEIDESLERLKGYRAAPYEGDWLRLKVAEAAAKIRPQAALEIYRDHAERLIERQGRHNYHDACGYLKKVQALYDKLGQTAAWTKEAGRLREKYQRFPAFLDEMNRARL